MKKILTIVLLFILITTTFSGCVEEETPTPIPTVTPTPTPTATYISFILYPSSPATGDLLTVHGTTNLPPENDILVRVEHEFVGPTLVVVPVNIDGTFNTSFNTAGWPPGAYTVTARPKAISVVGETIELVEETIELLLSPTEEIAYEKAIFDEINRVRVENGINALSRNKQVGLVARNHSIDMATRRYFQHTDPEGGDCYDRLIKAGVPYIVASECLSLFPFTEKIDRENVCKEIVEGWLESPGHRSVILDRDKLYSEGGVGVEYRSGYLYVTANFISNKWEGDTSLNYQYTIFYYLYDPTWDIGFPDEVVAQIEIKADQPIDIYIVRSREEYDKFLKGYTFDYVDCYKQHRYINETRKVVAGYGIILSNEYYSTPVDINLSVYYPSEDVLIATHRTKVVHQAW